MIHKPPQYTKEPEKTIIKLVDSSVIVPQIYTFEDLQKHNPPPPIVIENKNFFSKVLIPSSPPTHLPPLSPLTLEEQAISLAKEIADMDLEIKRDVTRAKLEASQQAENERIIRAIESNKRLKVSKELQTLAEERSEFETYRASEMRDIELLRKSVKDKENKLAAALLQSEKESMAELQQGENNTSSAVQKEVRKISLEYDEKIKVMKLKIGRLQDYYRVQVKKCDSLASQLSQQSAECFQVSHIYEKRARELVDEIQELTKQIEEEKALRIADSLADSAETSRRLRTMAKEKTESEQTLRQVVYSESYRQKVSSQMHSQAKRLQQEKELKASVDSNRQSLQMIIDKKLIEKKMGAYKGWEANQIV